MPCTPFTLPDGSRGIACGTRRKCGCRHPMTLLCDWKVEGGTCDKALCAGCTYKPAPGKDLCPTHAAVWKSRAFRPA